MVTFSPPVKGYKVTNGFGTKAPVYNAIGYHGHNGHDYPTPEGVPVYAMADGVIRFSNWGKTGGYGYAGWMGDASGISVLIQHEDGTHTDYCHLSRSLHEPGDRVKRGQLIGYTGKTGLSIGPHLHVSRLPRVPNWGNGYGGRIDFKYGTVKKAVAKVQPKQKAKRYFKLPRKPRAGEFWVKVNPGNTLSGLADWKNTTVAKVLKLNPQIDNASKISVGEIIRLK